MSILCKHYSNFIVAFLLVVILLMGLPGIFWGFICTDIVIIVYILYVMKALQKIKLEHFSKNFFIEAIKTARENLEAYNQASG